MIFAFVHHSFAAELSTHGMLINSLFGCNEGFGKTLFTLQLFLAARICLFVRRKSRDGNQFFLSPSSLHLFLLLKCAFNNYPAADSKKKKKNPAALLLICLHIYDQMPPFEQYTLLTSMCSSIMRISCQQLRW